MLLHFRTVQSSYEITINQSNLSSCPACNTYLIKSLVAYLLGIAQALLKVLQMAKVL